MGDRVMKRLLRDTLAGGHHYDHQHHRSVSARRRLPSRRRLGLEDMWGEEQTQQHKRKGCGETKSEFKKRLTNKGGFKKSTPEYNRHVKNCWKNGRGWYEVTKSSSSRPRLKRSPPPPPVSGRRRLPSRRRLPVEWGHGPHHNSSYPPPSRR